MLAIRCIAAIALVLVSGTAAQADSWISRAIYAHGKLWLLNEDGSLSSIVKDYPPVSEKLDQPVLDLIRHRDDPVIVSCETKTCENWLVRRRTKNGWKLDTKIRDADDHFVALAGGDRVVLVTNRRVIDLTSPAGKGVHYKLSRSAFEGLSRVTSTLVTGNSIWIGRNAGEWGGSLHRIDLVTGKAREVQRPFSGPPEKILLEDDAPYITNVNALLQSRWNPNCILVAQGLVHFAPSGEILQVCGEKISPFYKARFERQGGTVSFYGLMADRDSIWAAGIDGLHRIDANGRGRRTPYPRLSRSGDISLSFNLPRAVLVATEVHRRTSVSGAAPLLVPREN